MWTKDRIHPKKVFQYISQAVTHYHKLGFKQSGLMTDTFRFMKHSDGRNVRIEFKNDVIVIQEQRRAGVAWEEV